MVEPRNIGCIILEWHQSKIRDALTIQRVNEGTITDTSIDKDASAEDNTDNNTATCASTCFDTNKGTDDNADADGDKDNVGKICR